VKAMSSQDILLSRLDGVKRTGQQRWIAKCPAHDDKRPSLAVRELDDGRILIHDFAGCDVRSILTAVGLEFSDLFPERALDHRRPERRPFNAHDILACVSFEALLVSLAATNLAQGLTPTQQDHERLIVAAARLQHAAEVAHA
jgi:hypothetical protein